MSPGEAVNLDFVLFLNSPPPEMFEGLKYTSELYIKPIPYFPFQLPLLYQLLLNT